MNVFKRDGSIVEFDKSKIVDAIYAAAVSVGGSDKDLARDLTEKVISNIESTAPNEYTVEFIQDMIERILIKEGHAKTAKAFILYRKERSEKRDRVKVRTKIIPKTNSTDIHLQVSSNSLTEYTSWSRSRIVDALVKETSIPKTEANKIAKRVEKRIINSGLDHISTGMIREMVDNELFELGHHVDLKKQSMLGMPKQDVHQLIVSKTNENSNIAANNPEAINLAIAETVLKQYALQEVFSPEVADAHNNGAVHLHDLGYPARVYCSSHSLEYIKKYGLNLDNLDTSSAPAKHARTLTGHLNTFLASMQAYYAGALGVGYINIMYAPLVDGMTEKEMEQEAQYLIFSTSQNAFSRGGQTLFVDYNVHSGVPKYMKNIKAIGPGGKYLDKTYGDFEETATKFTKAMLSVWEKGDQYGNIFAFPKCIAKETVLHVRIDDEPIKNSDVDFYNDTNKFYATSAGLLYHFLDNFPNVYLPKYDRTKGKIIPVRIKNCQILPETDGVESVLVCADGIVASNLNTTLEHKNYVYSDSEFSIVESKDLRVGDNLYAVVKGDKKINEKYYTNSLQKVTVSSIIACKLVPVAIEVDHTDHDFITGDGIITKNCDFHISKETFTDPKQYELFQYACEIASKNGTPYFIFDRDEVTLSACCRLRTVVEDNYMIEHPESMRFLGFQNITINLPQCAYKAGKGNYDKVFEEIEKSFKICIQGHLDKKKFIKQLMSGPTMPLWQIGKIAEDGRPYADLDAATYIVGIIGLNECLQYLTGKELHEGDEAVELGARIISHLYLCVQEAKQKYGMKVTIEESPAESAARRLAKLDVRNYPEAKAYVRGSVDDDEVYYTNSIHLRPDINISLIDRIVTQAKFHNLIESGAIIHAFIGEAKPSAEAIAKVVKTTFEKTNAAQLTFSPEFTTCSFCHSVTPGMKKKCPACGSSNLPVIEHTNDVDVQIRNSWSLENINALK